LPRYARKRAASGIYHVVMRGVNKQTIFEEANDKKRYLYTLQNYQQVCGFSLYAYCLMDNHIHLLLKENNESISQAMKRISSSYVYWYNMKYDRCGHLFQERFHSEKVEDPKYFLTVLRYIHQNPLKAGLISNVWEEYWSSIFEYVSDSSIVHVTPVMKLFNVDPEKAKSQYISYMEEVNEDHCLEFEDSVRINDEQLRTELKKMGIIRQSQFQQMSRDERNSKLAKIRKIEGTSIRQISRVTGISKSVIGRIGGGT